MSSQEEPTLTIITTADSSPQQAMRGGGSRGGGSPGRVARSLKVSDLRDQLARFMTSLRSILPPDPEPGSAEESLFPFELTEIQVAVEIAANGEFKLVGTGVGVTASNSLTLVLTRRDPSNTNADE